MKKAKHLAIMLLVLCGFAHAAAPLTPTIPEPVPKAANDRGLPRVTHVKGYWLGSANAETPVVEAPKLPSVFTASVSLTFSEQATMATVVGILGKVTGIPILLPGAVEYPAAPLFTGGSPSAPKGKNGRVGHAKKAYSGTPKELLDRISVKTGMLWEYQDETIVFSE